MKPQIDATDTLIDSNRMAVSLAGQFFLTHLGAGLLGYVVTLFTLFSEPWARVAFIGSVTGVFGLLATWPLQRSLWVVQGALARLVNVLPLPALPQHGHGALGGLVRALSVLAERERPFADLREQQLRQTSEAAAQEARHRLARDLHDSIKQQIFSVHMSVAAAQARWHSDPDGAQAALADVRQSAQAALVEMNALLQQLSPAPLAKMGLVPALHEQAEALGYRTGAQVQVEIGALPDDVRFPQGAQETLFRIVQEAFSNIARHARAQHVTLTLAPTKTEAALRLLICDDGQGFKMEERGSGAGGMGLVNMQQRVADLEGHLQIESVRQQGTTIDVSIPLSDYVSEEVYERYQSDHTLNRVGLMMLASGVVVTAVLFYPLYVVLPKQFVSGWPDGVAGVGLVLIFLSFLLIGRVGYGLAKYMGASGAWQRGVWGGLGGMVMGMMIFSGVGGAAAGVIGNKEILAHGLVSADNDLHLLWLLNEGLTVTMWWTHLGFWLLLLLGGLVGGLGGWLAPVAKGQGPRLAWHRVSLQAHVLGVTAAYASTFMLVLSVALFSLLGPQVRDADIRATVAGYVVSWPVDGVVVWPILSPLIFYLVAYGVLYGLLRAIQPRHSATTMGYGMLAAYQYMLGAMLLPLPLSFITNSVPGYGRIVAVVGCGLNLAVVWLLGRQAHRLARRLPADQTLLGSHVGTLFHFGLFGMAAVIALGSMAGYFGLVAFLWLGMMAMMAGLWFRQKLWVQEGEGMALALPRTMEVIVVAILLMTTIAMVNVSFAISTIGLTVLAIGPLTPDSLLEGTITPFVEIVSQLYQMHIYGLGGVLLLSSIVIGLVVVMVWIYSGRLRRLLTK